MTDPRRERRSSAAPGRGASRELWVVARSMSFEQGVGGMERAIADQCRTLASLGWGVTLVTARQITGPLPREARARIVPWPGGESRSFRPRFGLSYALWTQRVRRALRDEMPPGAALYTHGGASNVLRGSWRPLTVRAVANPHGMEEFARSGFARRSARVVLRYLARGARRADAVVATDEALVRPVERNLSVPRERILVIPNAVDHKRLVDLAQAGASRALEADLVSVGRIVPNKGYDLLVDAVRILEQRLGRSLRWVHFGSGHARDHLEALAAKEPAVNLRVVQGADDQMVQATIALVGLFVQPSRYEGSSLTTLEAMAQGARCVGTPVGGIPEKLTDGVTGALAADVSAMEIANAVERALDPALDLGGNARARVQELYDIRVVTDTLSRALATDGTDLPRRVVQVARHIGSGSGVAQVVQALEQEFVQLGVPCERVTLATTGLRWRTPIGASFIKKVSLLIEVVWFTLAGSVVVRRARVSYPDAVVLVHGDPLGGDAFVNHGLLKQVMRERRTTVPANPMHWFTLVRDEIRYRSRVQRAIVCLTESDRSILQSLYRRVLSPIEVIPNGVDVRRYESADEEWRARMRDSLHLGQNAIALLFVGHEYERKGLYLLLEALSMLDARFRLIVVGGTTEMRDEAQRFAMSQSVNDRVRFVGSQSDPRPYYAAADIVVLPSAYETGPLVLLEALAVGRMVVMTNTGLAPEILQAPDNGALVERTAASVRDGVLLCAEKLDRDRDGAVDAARRSVAPYSWRSLAARYLSLLAYAR